MPVATTPSPSGEPAIPTASAQLSFASPRSQLVSVLLRGRSELIVQAIEDHRSWHIPQQEQVRASVEAYDKTLRRWLLR